MRVCQCSLGIPNSRRKATDKGDPMLTETEALILKMMAKGLTNKQIMDTLHITSNTIKTHLSHIYGKLGLALTRGDKWYETTTQRLRAVLMYQESLKLGIDVTQVEKDFI